MNTEGILKKYLTKHDALGKQKDAPDKEAFDIAHRQVWSDCDNELRARKVELEAKASLSEEETQELDELNSRFLEIPD